MQYQPLVQALNETETSSYDEVAPCEPGLLPSSTRLLRSFKIPAWRSEYAMHLVRKIERNPRDLFSHTQRVLMHFGQRNRDECFSALVDLFIVLGRNGYELRCSLMQRVCELLSADQFQFLKQRVRRGVSADEYIPGGVYCCLSHGVAVGVPLVEVIDDEGDEIDLLTLAREKLEQGERDDARVLLEEALASDPGGADICSELLGLYRDDDLPKAFYTTYYRYAGRSLAMAEEWKALDRHFQSTVQRQQDS